MMRNVVKIWMIALAGALLLPVACTRSAEPDSETEGSDGSISFEAGVSLLRDDATRSTTDDWPFINRTAFKAGETFRAFARRTGEGSNIRILGDDGVLVTSSDHDGDPATPLKWNYTPSSFWYWVSVSNYYDFLAAFYPDPVPDPSGLTAEEIAEIRADKDAHRMEANPGVDIPGAMAIQKSFAIKKDHYDLLMAGTRRSGANADTRSRRVPLTFHHMLCAVRVGVTNESSGKTATINSIRFDNLVQKAYAKATINSLNETEFSWINTERTSADTVIYNAGATLAINDGSLPPDSYTLLIPADLSVAIDGSLEPDVANYAGRMDEYETDMATFEDKLPHLFINYTPEGEAIARDARIVLRNVKRARYGESESIDEWDMGIKYTYNVVIRLDGAVRVTVVTTQWDDVDAETPGLLIEARDPGLLWTEGGTAGTSKAGDTGTISGASEPYTYTYPTIGLYNPYGISPITFSSSNTSVATIGEHTGTLTLVGPGDTTITASFDGDSLYNPAEVSYVLHVVRSEGE